MRSPDRDAVTLTDRDLCREKAYDISSLIEFLRQSLPMLVSDQEAIYQNVMRLVESGNGGLCFIDARGGTGKTFLINVLLAEVRRHGGIAVAMASSGVAATLLAGGRTAHSTLKLPLNVHTADFPVCNIAKSSGQAEVLKQAKLIVWDECTMAHKKSFEALNRTLQDLREDSRLMGGAVVVLGGDYRQTLPVVPRGTPADELNACMKSTRLWDDVQTMELKTNMRVRLGQGDIGRFAEQLLLIGEGRVAYEDESGLITFPSDFCTLVKSCEELIERVFPDIHFNYKSHKWLCARVILAPRNDGVKRINDVILAAMPGESVTYLSVDTVTDIEQAVYYPTEFLNSLEISRTPPHRLEVKVGSPVILLRNLDPPRLCNGTRLAVIRLLPNVIEATIITGNAAGENVFVPRIPLIHSDAAVACEFKRLQFPLRIAFAMSINKSQGQSLNVAGVDLSSSCFSHGQLYVACSRVGSPDHLFVYAPMGKTHNVVYRQALQ